MGRKAMKKTAPPPSQPPVDGPPSEDEQIIQPTPVVRRSPRKRVSRAKSTAYKAPQAEGPSKMKKKRGAKPSMDDSSAGGDVSPPRHAEQSKPEGPSNTKKKRGAKPSIDDSNAGGDVSPPCHAEQSKPKEKKNP